RPRLPLDEPARALRGRALEARGARPGRARGDAERRLRRAARQARPAAGAAAGRPRRARLRVPRGDREAPGARPEEDRHGHPAAGVRQHDPAAADRVRPESDARHAREQAREPEGRARAGARQGERGVPEDAARRARPGARSGGRRGRGGGRRPRQRRRDRAMSAGSVLIQPQRIARATQPDTNDSALGDIAQLAVGIMRDALGGGQIVAQFEASGEASAQRVLAQAQSGLAHAQQRLETMVEAPVGRLQALALEHAAEDLFAFIRRTGITDAAAKVGRIGHNLTQAAPSARDLLHAVPLTGVLPASVGAAVVPDGAKDGDAYLWYPSWLANNN